MIEIGVGGGSLARIDTLGLLAVRAGAPRAPSPGPACYGRAGSEPTVTDADLVLGYLDPGFFLGGDDDARRRGGARRRSERTSPSRSGSTVEQAALGSTRSSTRTWPAPRACTPPSAATTPTGLAALRLRRRRPGARVRRRRARSARRRVIVPAAAGVMTQRRRARRADGLRRRAQPGRSSRSATRSLERAGAAVRRDGGARAPRCSATPASRRARSRYERSSTCATSARASRSPVSSTTRPRAPEGLRDAFEAAYERRHGRRGPGRPGRGHQLARDSRAGPSPDVCARRARRDAGRRARRARARATSYFDDGYRRRRRSTTATGSGPGTRDRRARRSSRSASRPLSSGRGRDRRRGAGRQPRHRPRGGRGMSDAVALDPLVVGLAVEPPRLDPRRAAGHARHAPRSARSCASPRTSPAASSTARGSMLGQSHSGTPGHINAMATGVRHFVERLPARVARARRRAADQRPVDDGGQINDLTVVTPVFRGGRADRLLRLHLPRARHRRAPPLRRGDRGVRGGPAAADHEARARGRDERGRCWRMIRANVAHRRDETDRRPLRPGRRQRRSACAASLRVLSTTSASRTLEEVGAEICRRSEEAMRSAIAELPDGRYEARRSRATASASGSSCALALIIDGDEIDARLRGLLAAERARHQRRPQLHARLRVVRAEGWRSRPSVPHNAGSFAPVHVTAPEGCILNCTPAGARSPPATSSATSCPALVLGRARARARRARARRELGRAVDHRLARPGRGDEPST